MSKTIRVPESAETCLARFVELKEQERKLMAMLREVRKELAAVEPSAMLLIDKREKKAEAAEAKKQIVDAQQQLMSLAPPSPPVITMQVDTETSAHYKSNSEREREHAQKMEEYNAVLKVRKRSLREACQKFESVTCIPVKPSAPDMTRYGPKGAVTKKIKERRESLNKSSIGRLLYEYMQKTPTPQSPDRTYVTNAVQYIYKNLRKYKVERLDRKYERATKRRRCAQGPMEVGE